MKKIITLLFLGILIISCSNEDNMASSINSVTLKIQIKNKELKTYSNFIAKVTELQTGNIYDGIFDVNGISEFNLSIGSYDIDVEELINGERTMYGNKKNLTIKADKKIEIEVTQILKPTNKTFVLDELYFNGADNGIDWKGKTFNEQYFTIRNISDKPLYADGISIGIVADYNALENNEEFEKVLPKQVFLSQFYTIPGNGTKYKVEPNKSLVIARSAINHNENNKRPKSLNLTGADFEIYVDHPDSMTADNPEVTNLIVDYSKFKAFSWQYSGSSPIILFKLNQNHKTFFENNKENLSVPGSFGTMKGDYMKLPTDLIIDGVETGIKDLFYRKVLPKEIDLKSILVEVTSMYDGFTEQFIKRKIITKNGKETVQDTNDSSVDFELLVGGQRSYPK